MSIAVVELFEGLTTDQAKAFRDRILPTLADLRAEIVDPNVTKIVRDIKTKAIRRRLRLHERTCTYFVFSGDRHCSCGRDAALAELDEIERALRTQPTQRTDELCMTATIASSR